MGRRTYELFLKYWPTAEARKEEPALAKLLTDVPKLVFSRTLTSSTWENTRFVSRPVAEVVREEKQGSGGHILFLGSANLLTSLWKEHLVDELHVRVQPIVLGKGRPLFSESEFRQPLALKECRMFASGVAGLRYEVGTRTCRLSASRGIAAVGFAGPDAPSSATERTMNRPTGDRPSCRTIVRGIRWGRVE